MWRDNATHHAAKEPNYFFLLGEWSEEPSVVKRARLALVIFFACTLSTFWNAMYSH